MQVVALQCVVHAVVAAFQRAAVPQQTSPSALGTQVLQVFATENFHAPHAGVKEKKYRKWQWKFLKMPGSFKLFCFFSFVFLSFYCNTYIFQIYLAVDVFRRSSK